MDTYQGSHFSESNDTEESVADNFNDKKTAGNANTTGPSQVPSGQGADGYAHELYALRDEQLAKEKGKAVCRDLHETQFV